MSDDHTPSSGHNDPPSTIEFAHEATGLLGKWLLENPVIQTEESAREGKLLVDRAILCLQDLEAERDGAVRPLNEQVKDINNKYRPPRDILTLVLNELKERIDGYRQEEEARRRNLAEQARLAAEEAAERLREAEERLADHQEDADTGVESDVAESLSEVERRRLEAAKLLRTAIRSDRDTDVRIGGGFRAALTARTKENLVVTDPVLAVSQIGWTEKLIQCIREEARTYRREHGLLPGGIISERTRRI